MGQIYLIRHGQASFGSANYDELSKMGHEQARHLGEWFGKCQQKFHRVVTGDLKRHQQTAQACTAAMPEVLLLDAQWETDPGFNEYDHHEVLVRHRPAFDDPAAVHKFFAETPNARYVFQELFQKAMARWMSGEHDADYREPWSVFRTRCIAALERVIDSAGKSQNIAVFTSGGTIATLCQHVLGFPDRQVAELNWSLVNCAVTRLMFRPGVTTLSYLNSFAHLEALGQPEIITYR
ncbi:MAG TPA: histidine phosphatase family protein [Noviherbaspirillum sp.]|jgi:broad specificity phosphatase PhoE|uniref:histidine phosphatase family protein n=1 Tax=Noviherbaspirillum sp. TaxID=1926288 RepID=UPI002DDD0335|nr:histidine phosphatase family protein [Noviherbaspirillum sp.]HEV2612244.1 histidine phosphatase family protein [Noviherbaspirillum sp.]